MPTVAMIVIGEEILTGKFADANGPFAITTLRSWGSRLVRLSVIEDDVSRIADEIRRSLVLADFVITTGGIGPTHDDVTLEAVALAHGRVLETRPELVALLHKFGLPDDEANRRMTRMPTGTELIQESAVSFPIIRCDRTFVFPGIPKLFQRQLLFLKPQFLGQAFYTSRAQTMNRESEVALTLTKIANEHPTVSFGSYPRPADEGRQTLITLQSSTRDDVQEALDALSLVIDALEVGPIEIGGEG